MNIEKHIRRASTVITDSETIRKLHHCAYGADAFIYYTIQRAKLAVNFQGLLRAGIAKAEAVGAEELQEALQKNLDDELGMDEQGNTDPENAHILWRKNYLKHLGITDTSFQATPPLPKTAAHCEGMLELERSGSLWFLAGALLYMEFIIPLEYRAVRESRDYLFLERFVVTPSDTEEQKQVKHKARLYIDDHITHDIKSHYPWLLSALNAYAHDSSKMTEMANGIEYIAQLRKNFYHEVGATMQKVEVAVAHSNDSLEQV